MRSILIISLFATLSLLVFGRIPSGTETPLTFPGNQQSGEDQQTLIRLDREIMEAAARNDSAAIGRIELDTAIFINPGGGIEERGGPAIEGPKIESIQTEDVRVRLYGDTAILTGRANVKGRFASGQDITGAYRYMRVFVKTKGAWRVAATQATRIAEPSKSTSSPQPTPSATP